MRTSIVEYERQPSQYLLAWVRKDGSQQQAYYSTREKVKEQIDFLAKKGITDYEVTEAEEIGMAGPIVFRASYLD